MLAWAFLGLVAIVVLVWQRAWLKRFERGIQFAVVWFLCVVALPLVALLIEVWFVGRSFAEATASGELILLSIPLAATALASNFFDVVEKVTLGSVQTLGSIVLLVLQCFVYVGHRANLAKSDDPPFPGLEIGGLGVSFFMLSMAAAALAVFWAYRAADDVRMDLARCLSRDDG